MGFNFSNMIGDATKAVTGAATGVYNTVTGVANTVSTAANTAVNTVTRNPVVSAVTTNPVLTTVTKPVTTFVSNPVSTVTTPIYNAGSSLAASLATPMAATIPKLTSVTNLVTPIVPVISAVPKIQKLVTTTPIAIPPDQTVSQLKLPDLSPQNAISTASKLLTTTVSPIISAPVTIGTALGRSVATFTKEPVLSLPKLELPKVSLFAASASPQISNVDTSTIMPKTQPSTVTITPVDAFKIATDKTLGVFLTATGVRSTYDFLTDKAHESSNLIKKDYEKNVASLETQIKERDAYAQQLRNEGYLKNVDGTEKFIIGAKNEGADKYNKLKTMDDNISKQVDNTNQLGEKYQEQYEKDESNTITGKWDAKVNKPMMNKITSFLATEGNYLATLQNNPNIDLKKPIEIGNYFTADDMKAAFTQPEVMQSYLYGGTKSDGTKMTALEHKLQAEGVTGVSGIQKLDTTKVPTSFYYPYGVASYTVKKPGTVAVGVAASVATEVGLGLLGAGYAAGAATPWAIRAATKAPKLAKGVSWTAAHGRQIFNIGMVTALGASSGYEILRQPTKEKKLLAAGEVTSQLGLFTGGAFLGSSAMTTAKPVARDLYIRSQFKTYDSSGRVIESPGFTTRVSSASQSFSDYFAGVRQKASSSVSRMRAGTTRISRGSTFSGEIIDVVPIEVGTRPTAGKTSTPSPKSPTSGTLSLPEPRTPEIFRNPTGTSTSSNLPVLYEPKPTSVKIYSRQVLDERGLPIISERGGFLEEPSVVKTPNADIMWQDSTVNKMVGNRANVEVTTATQTKTPYSIVETGIENVYNTGRIRRPVVDTSGNEFIADVSVNRNIKYNQVSGKAEIVEVTDVVPTQYSGASSGRLTQRSYNTINTQGEPVTVDHWVNSNGDIVRYRQTRMITGDAQVKIYIVREANPRDIAPSIDRMKYSRGERILGQGEDRFVVEAERVLEPTRVDYTIEPRTTTKRSPQIKSPQNLLPAAGETSSSGYLRSASNKASKFMSSEPVTNEQRLRTMEEILNWYPEGVEAPVNRPKEMFGLESPKESVYFEEVGGVTEHPVGQLSYQPTESGFVSRTTVINSQNGRAYTVVGDTVVVRDAVTGDFLGEINTAGTNTFDDVLVKMMTEPKSLRPRDFAALDKKIKLTTTEAPKKPRPFTLGEPVSVKPRTGSQSPGEPVSGSGQVLVTPETAKARTSSQVLDDVTAKQQEFLDKMLGKKPIGETKVSPESTSVSVPREVKLPSRVNKVVQSLPEGAKPSGLLDDGRIDLGKVASAKKKFVNNQFKELSSYSNRLLGAVSRGIEDDVGRILEKPYYTNEDRDFLINAALVLGIINTIRTYRSTKYSPQPVSSLPSGRFKIVGGTDMTKLVESTSTDDDNKGDIVPFIFPYQSVNPFVSTGRSPFNIDINTPGKVSFIDTGDRTTPGTDDDRKITPVIIPIVDRKITPVIIPIVDRKITPVIIPIVDRKITPVIIPIVDQTPDLTPTTIETPDTVPVITPFYIPDLINPPTITYLTPPTTITEITPDVPPPTTPEVPVTDVPVVPPDVPVVPPLGGGILPPGGGAVAGSGRGFFSFLEVTPIRTPDSIVKSLMKYKIKRPSRKTTIFMPKNLVVPDKPYNAISKIGTVQVTKQDSWSSSPIETAMATNASRFMGGVLNSTKTRKQSYNKSIEIAPIKKKSATKKRNKREKTKKTAKKTVSKRSVKARDTKSDKFLKSGSKKIDNWLGK
jgi:hypothetical protein